MRSAFGSNVVCILQKKITFSTNNHTFALFKAVPVIICVP